MDWLNEEHMKTIVHNATLKLRTWCLILLYGGLLLLFLAVAFLVCVFYCL